MTELKNLFDLTDRVALVTGGSRGLGREMAEGLAEAGAKLMILARREQWLAPTLDEFRVRGYRCEGVDILVNNAGVSWGAPAEEMPLDKWRMVLDTNLTGAFLFCQAAGDDSTRLWPHHQHRFHQRHSGRAADAGDRRFRIRGGQGWADLADARAGRQVGAPRHPRKRHRARIFSHPHDGKNLGPGAGDDAHASADESWSFWPRTPRTTLPGRPSLWMAAQCWCREDE